MLRCLTDRPLVIFGDGTQTRDFTYVGDTARGIIEAGTAEDAVGRTINLGGGAEISIGELAREVANVVGHPDAEVIYDAPRPGDVLRLYSDTALAEQILGFEPRVSMHQGLTQLRAWYLSQSQSPQELLEQEILHNWQQSGVGAVDD